MAVGSTRCWPVSGRGPGAAGRSGGRRPRWPSPDPVDKGFVRDEIGCALRLAPSVVQSKLHTASQLVDRLPDTPALLETGDISLSHARVLVDAVLALDDPLAAKVEARVLARAPHQSL